MGNQNRCPECLAPRNTARDMLSVGVHSRCAHSAVEAEEDQGVWHSAMSAPAPPLSMQPSHRERQQCCPQAPLRDSDISCTKTLNSESQGLPLTPSPVSFYFGDLDTPSLKILETSVSSFVKVHTPAFSQVVLSFSGKERPGAAFGRLSQSLGSFG